MWLYPSKQMLALQEWLGRRLYEMLSPKCLPLTWAVMLSLRSIWRGADRQLGPAAAIVRARSFETKVSQDDARGRLERGRDPNAEEQR
jgi:hypothetical protein